MLRARPAFPLLLLAAFLGRCSPAPPRNRSAEPTNWNVLLVSVDTLRADHLSSYGAVDVRTPRIDALASEGVLFEEVATVSPTTLPAHASLFTGRNPLGHGARDNVGFYLETDVPTLAAHLSAHGYETAGFVGAFVLDARFGIARGFDLWDDELGNEAGELEAGTVAQRRGDSVLAAFKSWLQGRTEPRPFFAFVHFYDPHAPYDAPGDDDRARYRGEVAFVDGLVGELRDALDASPYRENTVVALTSDHGESLGEHGERTHGLFLYQSTLSIPLLLRYPGAPAGTRIPGLARIIDVAPTLLDLLGLPGMTELDGESLVPRIEGAARREERTAYAETLVPRLQYGWSELRSIRRGRYKLILAPRLELFDLETDPDESRDLASENPELAKSLRDELGRQIRSERAAAPLPIDAETRKRLESLGYVAAATGESARDDPKDRIDLYLTLNDPSLGSLGPDDEGFERALLRLERVIREAPSVPRAYVLYGDLLLRARRLGEAEANFAKLAEIGRESFEGQYGLGVARARQGKRAQAKAAFERALEIEPRNMKVHVQMAEMERAGGNGEAAEAWLRKAIAVSPDPFLYDELATLLESAGKSAEARALLEERLERSPRDSLAALHLGRFLLRHGEFEAAIPVLRRAAELDPDEADVHEALGAALAGSGDPEGAVEAFRRALSLSPCLAPAHANLGSAYTTLGRVEEAIESFERAVSCDPGYALAYKNLAAIELERGNVRAAVVAMRKAVAASPDDAELKTMLDEVVAYERSRN